MTIMKRLSAVLDTKLGRCPRCMRQSFMAAFAAWGLVLAISLVASKPVFMPVVLAAALWLAHLATFARRAALTARRASPSQAPALSRRQFLPIFVRVFVAAALLTALPAGMRALADDPCDACDKGAAYCFQCCSCKHDNSIAGCANVPDPDKRRNCYDQAATDWCNCNCDCNPSVPSCNPRKC